MAMVGDSSLHSTWIDGDKRFDLMLIYYGKDDNKAKEYEQNCDFFIRRVGQKYPTLKYIIHDNLEVLVNYEYIWLPDDDVEITTESLNYLFELSKERSFFISQPAVVSPHIISHVITKPVNGALFRYTNFVEPMAPCFKRDILLQLYQEFDLSATGWGLDFLWNHRLGNPVDKLAIIDDIVMVHTRPFMSEYTHDRYPKNALDELNSILQQFGIIPKIVNYQKISK